MDITGIIREACVETVAQALKAQQLGADRVELCSRLDLDGLTPSEKTITEAVNSLQISVKVMIRPREGDFVYNSDEIATMLRSIDYCKINKVSGIVVGVLDHSGNLDLGAIRRLADKAAPLPVTIHKAIDQTNDPVQAIEQLKSLNNVDAVLTSGKALTAEEGKEMIKEMIRAAGDDLKVVVAGKVKYDNLAHLHREINATEYHGRKIVG